MSVRSRTDKTSSGNYRNSVSLAEDEMPFSIQQDSDQRSFRLAGELDLATSGELIRQLGGTMQAIGDLRLDLQALEFVDSAGIRALITVCQELRGGRLFLRSPSGEVARVLDLIRADTFPNVVID